MERTNHPSRTKGDVIVDKFDDVSKTIESSDLFKSMENSNRVQFIALCVDVFKLGEKSKQAEVDELREMVRRLVDNTIVAVDDALENQANDLLKGDQS